VAWSLSGIRFYGIAPAIGQEGLKPAQLTESDRIEFSSRLHLSPEKIQFDSRIYAFACCVGETIMLLQTSYINGY
jgi:hypothetical protein